MVKKSQLFNSFLNENDRKNYARLQDCNEGKTGK